jgi:type VI protein secretion system component Hcp
MVEAKISGYSLDIPQQTLAGFTIEGYGTVSLNFRKIIWSYTVDYHNNFIDEVTATYTRP